MLTSLYLMVLSPPSPDIDVASRIIDASLMNTSTDSTDVLDHWESEAASVPDVGLSIPEDDEDDVFGEPGAEPLAAQGGDSGMM